MITPGIDFLVKTTIPTFFGFPALIHAILIFVSQFHSVISPTPILLVCIYVFLVPARLVVANYVSQLKEGLAARRLGARIAPSLQGALPGNIDLLYKGMSANKDEYLGKPLLYPLREHGTTFSIKILGKQRLCTINPKNIQKVLITDFGNYRRGKFVGSILEPMLGIGVFNSDGELWQFHRKLIRPFFIKERVTDLQLYERKTAIALRKMQDRFDSGSAVDFQDLVARFTLDSAAEFLLGASIDSLDSPLPLPYNSSTTRNATVDTPSMRFARSFAAAQVTLLNRVELTNLWPLAEIFEDKMKKPMEEVRRFMSQIIGDARRKHEQRHKQGGTMDSKTLVGDLLDTTNDMKMIMDETLNIVLAGRDTTACLLTFTTYCLVTHPKVMSRLREEIIRSIGRIRAPNYDDIRGMKYLRAVINETLRLFPPVPFNVREAINETTFVDDEGGKLYVPANSRVTWSTLHLHRSEKYWGEDAHIFDPDRWLDSRVHKYISNPFIFIPFNAGPRICVGQQLAYNEASFFLVQMLQHFRHLELAPECQPPKTRPPASWADITTAPQLGMRRPLEKCFPRAHLTLYADGGLWIRAAKSENVNTI